MENWQIILSLMIAHMSMLKKYILSVSLISKICSFQKLMKVKGICCREKFFKKAQNGFFLMNE